jgi:hypothetical protein
MLNIPGIKEMQIKTTLIFHLTLTRMVINNKTNNNKRWQGYAGKRNPYPLLVEMFFEVPQKTKNRPTI